MINQNKYSEHLNTFAKWGFAACFIIGAVAIIIGKGVFGWSQVLITVFPVSIMFFYAFFCYFRPYGIREDQAGDNLYFMGFLFTMVSLAMALYLFGTQGQEIEKIIENFGIALATTIVGVFLRVMMAQMRVDPADIEHVARADLAKSASDLSRILHDCTRELGVLPNAVRQTMEEIHKEHSKGMKQEMETFREQAKIMADAAKVVTQNCSALATEVDKIAERSSSFASQQNQSSEALKTLVSQQEQLAKCLVDSGKFFSVVEGKQEAIISGIERTSATLGNAVGVMERHNAEMETQLNKSNRYTEKVGQSLIKLVDQIEAPR